MDKFSLARPELGASKVSKINLHCHPHVGPTHLTSSLFILSHLIKPMKLKTKSVFSFRRVFQSAPIHVPLLSIVRGATHE